MISSCTAQQEQLPALHLSWTQAVLGHSYWLQLELTCLYLRYLTWSSQSLATGLGLSGDSFHLDSFWLLNATDVNQVKVPQAF